MTIRSSRTSNHFSSFILNFVVMVLMSLSLFVFPANAKTSGNNSASNTSNLAQFAQTRVCRPPSRMINGKCKRPVLLRCRVGTPRCANNNGVQKPANIRRPTRRCNLPNKMVNGRCTRPIVIRNPANIKRPANIRKPIRVCRRPNKLINGRCTPPGAIRNPANIKKPANIRKPIRVCRRPNKLINGRCFPPSVIRNPANVRKPVNLGKPIQRCRPPSKIINGRCIAPPSGPAVLKSACLPPSTIVNGICALHLPEKKELTCGGPFHMVNGSCVPVGISLECPQFQVRINGVCQLLTLQKTCPPTQTLIGNNCVPLAIAVQCLPPLVRIDGTCTTLNVIQPLCILPKKLIGGVCRLPGGGLNVAPCNPPLVRIGGVCKFPGLNNLCIPPKKMFGGVCRLPAEILCAPPRVRRGFQCVLPNPTCQAPFVRSPITNQCYLPFEVDIVPEAECFPPWFYSERSGGCVKLRPRLRSRESVVWVQSCLNTLGYRAGVEDGISGRQTRSAWEDFRRSLGLRGIVGFDDPETLGALYRECNSEPREVSEPRPVEPAGEPPLETAEPASDLKYRQSMCATGKLYSLLSEAYGDTIKLEQCGGSCLPIPEGMPEDNVRRLETDQGIQWCKDCVKIGDEGILCPAPALQ